MQSSTIKAGNVGEIVIPDCCNIGIVFRTLVMVNAVILAVILLQNKEWLAGLHHYIEASMIIAPACLWSLFGVCGFRRLLQRLNLMQKVSHWAQRLLCALVPAVVTAAIVQSLTSIALFSSSFTQITPVKGGFVSALFGLGLQHYFELRTRAFSPALVEARLQALQARIRPHFLFNSLNAVLSLIRIEPRRAETTLEDLADLFRVLMRDSKSMTTLHEEIHLCRQYLAIEKIRLGERLEVQWEMQNITDEIMQQARIPVLLLQPLLENAVHYGVEPAAVPVLIRVQITRMLDRIEIVVANPCYEGRKPVMGNHMALHNIRERLALLYDVEAQLTTTIGHGLFEVRLHFPYLKNPI